MIRFVLTAAAVLSLTACETPNPTTRDLDRLGRDYQQSSQEGATPQNADEATRADVCGASHYASLVGQPESAINRDDLPPRARIISPGMMVTQDFSPERLNLRIGPDGKVASVQCF
jgi:hypothetical protein